MELSVMQIKADKGEGNFDGGMQVSTAFVLELPTLRSGFSTAN